MHMYHYLYTKVHIVGYSEYIVYSMMIAKIIFFVVMRHVIRKNKNSIPA